MPDRRRALPLVDLRMLHAVQTNDLPTLAYGLELGRSINLRDRDGRSLLLRACRACAWASMNDLLDRGADPNLADPSGLTPVLELAFQADLRQDGQPEAGLLRLLAAGGDPNAATDLGVTPLMQAHDHPARVRALLAAGANVEARASIAFKGASVLTAAVLNGVGPDAVVRSRNLESLVALLDAGADPNGVDGNGRTPLAIAVDEPLAVPLARALLDAGADPDQVAPRFGQSPRERTRAHARPWMHALLEAHALHALPLEASPPVTLVRPRL